MGSGAAAFTAKGLRIQSVFAFALLKLRRTPRFAPQAPLGSATRSPKGEAWWARQDSNLQPDRYERPALTIELQAPPRTAAERGRQRCGHRLQRSSRSGNGVAKAFSSEACPRT